MPLLLQHCTFTGPALPEPFVRFELEKELNKAKLIPKITGSEGKELQEAWTVYRRKLRELATRGGAVRVKNHVITPLLKLFGYDRIESGGEVATREGSESGGELLVTADGKARLRVWCVDFETDLDAPARRGSAYRYSHVRIAQRVLLTCGERFGLLTNGVELRLLICDPTRPDSQVNIAIDPYWKRSRDLPDSFLLVFALACPDGVKALPDLVEKARLQQARVTKELRVQARRAVERFIQEILDHPRNVEKLDVMSLQGAGLAKQLWKEGLIIVYRLLFVLKLETSDNPAQAFSFASTSLWRNTFSPSMAIAKYGRKVLDDGLETGSLLESGMRALFKMFASGIDCTEMSVKPLGGALFGENATPVLSDLTWGERAVAHLLDQLLWTTPQKGKGRERVHYGPLDVEDLGRVYEALLELEPGITTEPMCRLRRQKLEVVVPVAQGEKYRPVKEDAGTGGRGDAEIEEEEIEEDDEEETPKQGKKTQVEWIEEIPPGRFYLRVGLGRKASGSYYTPHSFVRFLVKETLEPQINERSPQDNPNPGEILKLKVLDPAMGSGHFLVEACRYLGERLYEACRLCDELATQAEVESNRVAVRDTGEETRLLEKATTYRQRIIDLPHPNDKLIKYLPSAAPEGEETGLSQAQAIALCRRLVAVHCLYGVDKNPLAVELAKLSLWLESHAEGLPLTFLDHRLVLGDSLTGAFFEHLLKEPGSQDDVQKLVGQDVDQEFKKAIHEALKHVRDLEATIGVDISDMAAKEAAKKRLDRALAPFKIIAAAWSGGVMLGKDHCDDTAYFNLVTLVSETGDLPEDLGDKKLQAMIARGLGVKNVPSKRDDLLAVLGGRECVPALAYDLTFAEVFYPSGRLDERRGFDAVLGNPPWDAVRPKAKEFFAAFDFDILNAPTKRERTAIEVRLKADIQIATLHKQYEEEFTAQHRIHDLLYQFQVVRVNGEKTGGDPDAAKLFIERNPQLLRNDGLTGVVIPSGFHANEGATGIRQLYFEKMALKCCYSFENRRKLFEIDSRFKFATVVAKRGGITTKFPCAFYLHADEWLFKDNSKAKTLDYTLDFVRKTGGEYLSLLELRSAKDLEVAETCFANGEPFGKVCDRLGIRLGRELHMTDDAWRFTPTSEILPDGKDPRDPEVAKQLLGMGYLALHEGKTFHQFNDRWGLAARLIVEISKCKDKYNWLKASKYFRLQFREVTRATDERTAIACIESPGILNSYTATNERTPWARSSYESLYLCSIFNSFTFDWCCRQFVQIHLTLAIISNLRLPINTPKSCLSHSALRLTCNHTGYEPLWREQLGETWRDRQPPFTFPVLATEDERWLVRAAIDAVVANAYGLNREQYAHVLSTFSHKSYPKAPQLCLACFDELQTIGLEVFMKKYDPYWDIPLNENLPKPVIDLPIPNQNHENTVSTEDGSFQLTTPPKEKPKGRRKK